MRPLWQFSADRRQCHCLRRMSLVVPREWQRGWMAHLSRDCPLATFASSLWQKINCQTFSYECLISEIWSNVRMRTFGNWFFVTMTKRRSRVDNREKSRQKGRHSTPLSFPWWYLIKSKQGLLSPPVSHSLVLISVHRTSTACLEAHRRPNHFGNTSYGRKRRTLSRGHCNEPHICCVFRPR